MLKRVVIELDVTIDEAQVIAERLAGMGPHYEAWNLPVCLEELEEMSIPPGKLRRVYLRSADSAALGGPEVRPDE